jgi:hypothetical protein
MAKFNLNLSESTYADVGEMADRLDISMADVVREALSLLLWIIHEIRAGNRLMIQRGDQITELVVPELERLRDPPQPKRARPAKGDLARSG